MNKTNTRIQIEILAVALGSLIATACSPISGVPQSSMNNQLSAVNSGLTTNGGTTGTSLTTRQVGRYTCPALDVENITPNETQGINVVANYQVCTDSSSASDVLIFGSAGTNDQVCVFPTESEDTGTYAQTILWQHNPTATSGLPWYICGEPSPSGTVFTFTSLTAWNGAYIVDAAVALQMQTCLIEENEALCPEYSYGAFRN
jgi:hypothetical protein